MSCRYLKAWIGYCGSKNGTGLCREHRGVTCSCGVQAEGECAHAGQFVCGRPTCNGKRCFRHGGKHTDPVLQQRAVQQQIEADRERILHEAEQAGYVGTD